MGFYVLLGFGFAGVGVAFPATGEIHMDITKTHVESINVFDAIDVVCTKIMEW